MERQKAKLSRRELLKSLGIAGIGLSAFPFVTAFSDVHHQVAGLKETIASPITGTYIGTYSITCLKSQLVLDVSGGSFQNGAQVDQYYNNGGPNQQWRLYDQGNAFTYIIQSVNSGLVLDVRGGSLRAGAQIDQYTYHGGANQLWNVPLNGYNTVQSVKSGLYLDVRGGSIQPGAQVDQYTYHGGANQLWSFTFLYF